MKRILSIIICVSMVLSGCTAGGGAASTGAAGDGSSAGGTADAVTETAAETASETEAETSAGGENGSGSAGKPSLEVIGEEEEDFNRAVQNRSSKKAADPNVIFRIRSLI